MSFNDELINETEVSVTEQPDIREVIFRYVRHWKWFVVSILFFGGLGFIYIKLTTPKYKIETDLLIKDNKGGIANSNDIMKDLDLFTSDKIIDNEVQILRSKRIIEKVAKSLKLETSYFSTQGIRKRELYGLLPFEVELIQPYKTTSDPYYAYTHKLTIRLLNSKEAEVDGKKISVNTPYESAVGVIAVKPNASWKGPLNELLTVQFRDMADIIDDYELNLKIDPVSKQGTVLVITVEDAIPSRGIDFLNGIVKEYDNAALEDKNKVTQNTMSFIKERLDHLKESLGTVEKNVENYKSQNRIANIGSQSQILLQAVGDNDLQLNKVTIQLKVLQNLEAYLQKNENDPSSLPSMLGIEDATLLGLVGSLGEVQQKRLSLLQTVPETNPLVSSYNDQITGLKKAIDVSVKNLRNGLETTKAQLESKDSQFNSSIKNVPGQERGLLDVMRQQHLQDTLYMYLLQKGEETSMQLASGVADSRIIDEARSSKYPVKPVKGILYLLFLALGIFVPVIIMYLRQILNFKISRRSDVERVTEIPILAEISHSEDVSPLTVSTRPRSMVAEQIRAFRTNLQFVIPNDEQKVILFTSSISGEGKSFISLNLGASVALSGKKTVILELDLRKPKLHSGLDIDNNLGLSNYFIGKADYKDIIKQIPQQNNYYIITSGPVPPNPAELLGNGAIETLLKKLKEDFDYIILDAPPVGLVTDAQILSKYADATMYIVRHNYTAKSQVKVIDNIYRSQKFKKLNIVLNSISIQQGYGYGDGYGYGYGYGYYEEDNQTKRFSIKNIFSKK